MRRGIALAAVGALSVLGLAACGGGSGTTDSEPEATGGAEATGQGLTVWVDANREAAFQTAADKYTADTGNSVEIVVKDNDQMRTEFATQVPTG